MFLHEKVKEDLKTSMKAKDTVRTGVIKNFLTAFTNELVATGKKPQDQLTDEECLKVIKKLSKQRKDSIEQFEKGGREDLADTEKQELIIIQEYLPKEVSEDHVKAVVLKIKEQENVTDKSKMGLLIGKVMAELKGTADGSVVKKIVEESFN